DAAVRLPGKGQRIVRGKRDTGHGSPSGLEAVEFLSLGDVPQAQRSISPPGQHPFAVAGADNGLHRAPMALQTLNFMARVHFPDADEGVTAMSARDREPAIGPEGHAADRILVAPEAQETLAGREVEPVDAAPHPGEGAPALRVPCQAADDLLAGAQMEA